MKSNSDYQLKEFKKFLLTRLSVTNQLTEYLGTVQQQNSVAKKHTFHKIIVHKWSFSAEELFKTMKDHFKETFLPVDYQNHGNICTLYSSKIALITKIVRMDFMFPYQNSMFSIDIVFNDKTSIDLFGHQTTLEHIVNGVVCRRFTEKCELDLSSFCDDPEFVDNKIHFHKLSMLGHNATLMTRMARDVKILNMSKNKLSAAPFKMMNYFLKSGLVEVNLSHNEIASIGIIRLTATIERLWLEGNPLCDDYTPLNYVKNVQMKFPLLNELDGIPINQYGVTFPLWRNYLPDSDRKIKMLVEKFVMLYFTNYDSYRSQVVDFYAEFAKFCLSTGFTSAEENKLQHYLGHARNALHIVKKGYIAAGTKLYSSRLSINGVLASLRNTKHDPTTFTIDVAKYDTGSVMVIIDGVYKEYASKDQPENYFQFRRSFLLAPVPSEYSENYKVPATATRYCITNEMLSVTFANEEMKEHSFRMPIRNLNTFELINPTRNEKEDLAAVLAHATHLKEDVAYDYLAEENWDFEEALKSFAYDLRNKRVKANELQPTPFPLINRNFSNFEQNALPPMINRNFSNSEQNALPPMIDRNFSNSEQNALPPMIDRNFSNSEQNALPPMIDRNFSNSEQNPLPPIDINYTNSGTTTFNHSRGNLHSII